MSETQGWLDRFFVTATGGRAEDQLEASDDCINTSTSVGREVAGRRRASDLSYSLLDTDTPPS